MAETGYRFGPFVVDRTRYRVLRDGAPLELTPKLLDLLLHLLEHAGDLVTKEQLLDALWPEANVTDNAIAQAVSELRDALDDEVSTPRFIKTVARRGYRFIAPVDAFDRIDPIERMVAPAGQPAMSAATSAAHAPDQLIAPAAIPPVAQSIAVMDFANVTGDRNAAWLSAGIAETVTGDIRSMGRFRVVDRGRVMEAIRHTDGSLHQVAASLGATFAVVGSYQTNADRIRITGRIVNVESGDALADAKVDGPISRIFELQDQVVAQFSKELGLATPDALRGGTARETPSLEAYRAYTEAWLHLETLDLREIPQAIADFRRAITIDPGYALAFTGLASAELAAYEATRSDTRPASQLLDEAIGHAQRAVALDAALAEAHATLAFVLVSAWRTSEAVQVARRAVALEPTNWRHFFRLGHAAWGDERIRAANNTLSLYPDFAFAHFQIAMVHVARGHLRDAETVLRQGAAVQDRQVARGDRYPALGLHWLLGLVRLAQGDIGESLQEFEREEQRATPHRLYGREYEMNAVHARGACLLRAGRHAEAVACFTRSLELYPEHAQSHIGLALALRAAGSIDRAGSISGTLAAIVTSLRVSRPIEAALVEGQMLATAGKSDAAGAVLCTLLESAPPGFAAWTLPIEPLLLQLHGTEAFTAAVRTLADRAR
ncbi:MAG TPA: winged helix-turn-helix domain-containing protein [Vicinamibacterales bacterium]|nr:winged helix-turn-helix domain-containing protein [Vicinamibacterales bacterium]